MEQKLDVLSNKELLELYFELQKFIKKLDQDLENIKKEDS